MNVDGLTLSGLRFLDEDDGGSSGYVLRRLRGHKHVSASVISGSDFNDKCRSRG